MDFDSHWIIGVIEIQNLKKKQKKFIYLYFK